MVKSNKDLSEEELETRSYGGEKGTSIIDQVTAGFAAKNKKKERMKKETEKLISQIPSRHGEYR